MIIVIVWRRDCRVTRSLQGVHFATFMGFWQIGEYLVSRSAFISEIRTLGLLSLPMVFTQLCQMGMGVADVLMAGQVSAVDLAGVSLGGSLYWPAMLATSGLIMAVTPSVSQLHGAGRTSESGEVVRQALWLALVGGGLGFWGLGFSQSIYEFAGVDPQGIPVAVEYLNWVRWGLLPVLGYFALRYLCDGLSWTLPAMLIAASALIVKIPLNYLFIFGFDLGSYRFEAMGGAGAGPATAIVMTLELIAMLIVVRYSRINSSGFWLRFSWPDFSEISRLLKLGTPIAMAMFAEMAIFSAVTILIGRMGVEAVAAHQVATSVSGVMFMIPLALGMAASIRVGYNVGREDYVAARRSGYVAICLSLGVSVIGVLVLLIWRGEIAGLYVPDAQVLSIATTLLLFAAVFQPFDSVQVTTIGALRGYKDTRHPMMVALFCYWGVALPVGVTLGFGLFGLPELGVSGFWTALVVGLSLAAVVLSVRFNRLSQQPTTIKAMALR